MTALCLSAGMVVGCGSTDPPQAGRETGAAEEQSLPGGTSGSPQPDPTAGEEPTTVYVGAYDEAFRADLASYSGQQVRLTGEVRDLIRSRSSYELASPTDPDLDPLLISAQYAAPELEAGALVEVTGTVREEFEPPVVEESLEEEAGFYGRHVGEPYLDEAQVEVAGPPGP